MSATQRDAQDPQANPVYGNAVAAGVKIVHVLPPLGVDAGQRAGQVLGRS